MSAYVVNHDTINLILTFLKMDRDNQHCTRRLAEAAELETTDPDFWQKLGASLHMMDVRAVNARYREDEPPDSTYTYCPKLAHSKITAFTAARCLVYQCTEGDVPESPLYKALHELSVNWAFDLVRRLPGYETASAW